MNTKITGTHMAITDAIRSHVEKRVVGLGKIVDAADPTLLCEVEVGKTTNHHKSGDVFRAEFNLRYNGDQYRAVSQTSDLYMAIDDAQKQLLKELRRAKTKRLDSKRKGGAQLKRMVRQK